MTNTAYTIIGLVAIVGIVALVALTQQTNNFLPEDNTIGYSGYDGPSVEYDFVPNTLFEGMDGNIYLTNAYGIVLGYTQSRQHSEQSFDIYMHNPRGLNDKPHLRRTNTAGLSYTTTSQATVTLFEDEKGMRYGVLEQGQSSWVLPLAPAGTNEASLDYYPYWRPTAQGNVAGFSYYPPWFFPANN